MHPGPMNRGVEITVDPAELPGAVITQQVTNGIAVRMAVLFDLLGAEPVVDARARRREDQLMTAILLRGGRLLDQTGERDGDVRIVDARIVDVGVGLAADADDEVIDAAGCVVSPGFVDLHVHLREPGKEEAETIETGSRAAALGGFTAIVAMPNTDPTQDCVEVVDFVRQQGARAGLCEVLPAAAITVGRNGDQLAPFAELAAVGVRIFTDDGNGVQDPLLMRRAFEYSARSRHHPRPALRGGPPHRRCGDARGGVLQPVRSAGVAVDRRGTDGPSRHRTGPPHRCPGALPAPVDGGKRGAGPRRRRPTGSLSRQRPRPTTSA